MSGPLDLDAISRRVTSLREAGFTWTSVSMPVLEAAGVAGIEAQVDILGKIRARILG